MGDVTVIDSVAVPKARSAMVLHRRVYLTGALVAVLTSVVALVALVGLGGQGSAFVARDKARALLGAAQLDVAQSQAQLTLEFSDRSSATIQAALPAALAQQQKA